MNRVSDGEAWVVFKKDGVTYRTFSTLADANIWATEVDGKAVYLPIWKFVEGGAA